MSDSGRAFIDLARWVHDDAKTAAAVEHLDRRTTAMHSKWHPKWTEQDITATQTLIEAIQTFRGVSTSSGSAALQDSQGLNDDN